MLRSARFFGAALGMTFAFVAACTSDSSSNPSDAGKSDSTSGEGGSDGGSDATAMCAMPGGPTMGMADTHCTDPEAGAMMQPTDPASCHPDVAAPDGGADCPYGDTMFGTESDDDDCKYHVKWSAGPICEGADGVLFTVVATIKGTTMPLTGAGTVAEVFTTTMGDAGCDNASTHPGPNSGVVLAEGPPGTYKGKIVFDQKGAWTVRFHFHEECADVLPTSPHGHAAYHLTVP